MVDIILPQLCGKQYNMFLNLIVLVYKHKINKDKYIG